MPKVIIDDKTIDVPNGTLVVEAAKQVGIEIPVFCYHPRLQPVGMCRMCLVEVGTPKRGKDGQIEKSADGNPVIGWMPKLQTACTTVVSDGMAVRTNSVAVQDTRRSVVEFLLTSHPLDCPICDKGGECPLQNLTMAYGPGQSRFPAESKFHNEKRVPLGDLIMLDRERCIQCSRCIRFQEQVADDPVLGFQARGRGIEITTLSDPPFDSKFSGNTIDICPVGALTSRDFRLSARVWEVKDQSSICPHCSVGCNILIGERDHLIKRIVPRENQAVNEIWLCDKGRFVHHFTSAVDRVTGPLVRNNGTLKRVSWTEAIDHVATRFSEINQQNGAHALGGLAGDRVSNEDLYVFQKFFRQVLRCNNLDHRIGWSASNTGEELVRLYGAGVGTDLGTLGQNVTALVLGADPEQEQPVLRLRLTRSARNFGVHLIVANGRLTKAARYAKESILYRYGGEAALVYGMVRVILDDGLENNEFIGARVERFKTFQESLQAWSVERCAEISGVPADTIRTIARAFAQSPDGLILYGREAMQAEKRDPALASAISALLLVTGHVGKPNNGLIALYPHNNSMGAMDFGLSPEFGVGRAPVVETGLPAKEMMAGRVRGLYVMACDPASDPGFVKPECLVVQDIVMTETAKLADVILPAQSFAETDGTFTNSERRVQLFKPALKPVGEALPDWLIITTVARRMGANWSYKSAAQVMEDIVAEVPLYRGMQHAALAKQVITPRYPYGQGNPSRTPTEIAMGDLENVSSGKQWASVAESDPRFRFDLTWKPPQSPVYTSKNTFVLAVARSLYDRGTLVSRSQIVQPRVPAAFVEINSHDAEELSIANGSLVRVKGAERTWDVRASVDGHVPPGVVLMPNNLDGTAALQMGGLVMLERAQ